MWWVLFICIFLTTAFFCLGLNQIDLIDKYDMEVCEILNNSSLSSGKNLMDLICKMNEKIDNLVKLVENEDNAIKNFTVQFLRQGGPLYVKIVFNEEELKQHLYLSDKEMINLADLRNNSVTLFTKLKRTYKKHFIWFLI